MITRIPRRLAEIAVIGCGGVRSTVGCVAQVWNLLYRRFPTGAACVETAAAPRTGRCVRRFQIGDTAGCNPALQGLGFGRLLPVSLCLTLLASIAHAQPVAVTLQVDQPVLTVGATTTLRVFAQVQPAYQTNADRIFSWYIDLRNTNGTAARAEYSQLQKPTSDNDPRISSNGTTDGAHRRGVYDTFLNLAGAGKTSAVELLRVPVTGLSAGRTRFQVTAGSGVTNLTADFIVAPLGGGTPWIGGSYASAFADLEIVATNQIDAVLSLTVVPFGPGTNRATLTYPVASGFDYFLEAKDALGDGNWQTLPGAPHNAGQYVQNPMVPRRFYRLRIQPAGSVIPLALSVVPATGGTKRTTLSYPVSAGFNYYVEARDQLESGGWQTLPGAPHNTGSYVDESTAPRRFFRLRVEPAGP